jgi:hypothetical protein
VIKNGSFQFHVTNGACIGVGSNSRRGTAQLDEVLIENGSFEAFSQSSGTVSMVGIGSTSLADPADDPSSCISNITIVDGIFEISRNSTWYCVAMVGIAFASGGRAMIETIHVRGGSFDMKSAFCQSGTGIGAALSDGTSDVEISMLIIENARLNIVTAIGVAVGCGSTHSLGRAKIGQIIIAGCEIEAQSDISGIGVGHGNCTIDEIVLV